MPYLVVRPLHLFIWASPPHGTLLIAQPPKPSKSSESAGLSCASHARMGGSEVLCAAGRTHLPRFNPAHFPHRSSETHAGRGFQKARWLRKPKLQQRLLPSKSLIVCDRGDQGRPTTRRPATSGLYSACQAADSKNKGCAAGEVTMKFGLTFRGPIRLASGGRSGRARPS